MKNYREQLGIRLNALKVRYSDAMRGRMVPSSAALKTKKEIDALRTEIKELDRDAAERLALSKAPVDEVLEVIAIPLLADVINDVVAGVNKTLRKNGVQETIFGIYTAQIRKAALAMVDTLDHADANLPRLLDEDDTLIDALRKKLMSFIKQRLNIKNK